MSEEAFEATKIESTKGKSESSEVDALIAGALAELGSKPKEEEKTGKELKATPIPISAVRVKPEPKPAAEAPIKEPPVIEKKEPSLEDELKRFSTGALIVGTIVKIDPSGALVDIGYKSDGFIAPQELGTGLKIGDKVEAVIEKLESKEGYVLLSKEKADYEIRWKSAQEALKSKKVMQAKVINAVNGGLVAECEGIRGFIPASQVNRSSPDLQLKDFVGKTLPVKVIEANRRQGKIILSHKLGSIESDRMQASKIFDELEVGQVRHGKVTSLKSFGAFVDINGVEGLIHLTELSWKRVKHPSEVLKSGQEIDVFILGVDKVNRKLSLGLKELQPDPWAQVSAKYRVGQVVKVKILRLVKFGAFAEIEEGLEGLIHISELSSNKVNSPEEAVKPGDMVEAKILRILPEEQRIGLSIREAQFSKQKAEKEAIKQEENKITIGDIIAVKEKQKAEREAELAEESENVEEEKEEVAEGTQQDQGLT
ncbi:MAG TPA: S1 RNA-binding domain-containing protein [Candidatus Omnitrophota bacterium]|nr:S1 RNA-binding domain-containing protein [Candidatus Omnitrophota bacterium]